MTASQIAYEKPSLNASWLAFIAHLPTIFLTWLLSVIFGAIGFVAWLLVSLVLAGIVDGLPSDLSVLIGFVGSTSAFVMYVVGLSLIASVFYAIPAIYYYKGEVVTTSKAFGDILARPARYILAGVLITIAATVGYLLCIVPGILVSLVFPIYIHKIFNTDISVLQSFLSSFKSVFSTSAGWEFVAIQIAVFLLIFVSSVLTCGLGALVATPVATFFVQNYAFYKGLA